MTGQIVTQQGKTIVLNRTFKPTPDYTAPSVFAVGTGTTTPAAADTDLQTAITIAGQPTKAIDSGYPVLTEATLQGEIRCLVLTTECNSNTITEFGLKNTDSTKKLFSRAVFTGIAKTATVQLIITELDQITI